MEPTRYPRIKICCISSVYEAQLAIQRGASALGLVAKMPSGPGVISENMIAKIAATIPPAIGSFLLTSEQNVQAIIDQQRRCRVNTLQIVDRLQKGTYDDLRGALPGISLVQVIHVTGEESFVEACEVAEKGVDALLLDSGNPHLAVKQLGGTGRTHDWSISRRIREAVKVPIFLAGGLRVENVGEAVQSVMPFGIDLCSSVRTEGKLDELKLSKFIDAATAGALEAE